MLALNGFLASSAPARPEHHKKTEKIDYSAFNYTFVANETLPEVAARFDRGACAIARLNRFSDPLLVAAGDLVTIPAYNASDLHDDSCFLSNSTVGYSSCLYGGPHTYLSQTGDTVRRIANLKFNMTVESLQSEGDLSPSNDYGPDDVLPVDTETKIPLCLDTACSIKPLAFSYGTVVDLAKEYNVTYGQISTLNTYYTFSSYAEHGADGPTLGLVYDCKTLAGFNDTAAD